MRVLLLRLEAPLMAFGREMIDAAGPTRDDPDASLLTGLFANALGWRRGEMARLQALQDRLRFATRLDRPGAELRDYQIATLYQDEAGWTTRGAPEGREPSPSYKNNARGRKHLSHQRYRYFRADASLTLAAALDDPDAAPTLDDLAAALIEPARPLFIGRKPCLPSEPLLLGRVEAPTLLAALDSTPPRGDDERHRHMLARVEADAIDPARAAGREDQPRTTRRDWVAGVHAGQETRVAVMLERVRP
jgi:CRISPR system Cascade subunit CasD